MTIRVLDEPDNVIEWVTGLADRPVNERLVISTSAPELETRTYVRCENCRVEFNSEFERNKRCPLCRSARMRVRKLTGLNLPKWLGAAWMVEDLTKDSMTEG